MVLSTSLSSVYAQESDITIKGELNPKLGQQQYQYEIHVSGKIFNKGLIEISEYSSNEKPSSWMKYFLSGGDYTYTTRFDASLDTSSPYTIHVKNGKTDGILELFVPVVKKQTLIIIPNTPENNKESMIPPDSTEESLFENIVEELQDYFIFNLSSVMLYVIIPIVLIPIVLISVIFCFWYFRKNKTESESEPVIESLPIHEPVIESSPIPEPKGSEPFLDNNVSRSPRSPSLNIKTKEGFPLRPIIECSLNDEFDKTIISIFSSSDKIKWKKIHEANELKKDPWHMLGESQKDSVVYFEDEYCQYGENRFYKIIASNKIGDSDPTIGKFTAPEPPKPPLSVNDFEIQIDNSKKDYSLVFLNWNEPNDNGSKITHYTIEHKNKKFQEIEKIEAQETSCTIRVGKGNVYEFQIFATNAGGTSSPGIKKEKFLSSKPLDEYQQKAVSFRYDSPILVNAGPGSGKTTVIVERVKDLILNQNVPPNKILCVTFNTRSKENMTQRFNEDPDLKAQGIEFPVLEKSFENNDRTNVRTWNSLGRELAKLSKNCFFESSDTSKWIRNNCEKFGFDSEDGLKLGLSLFKTELITPDNLKDYLDSIPDPNDSEHKLEKFCKFYAHYVLYLKSLEKYDHADELVKAKDHLESSGVHNIGWSKKFDHVLIDEFQDNNYTQTEIAKLLAPEGKITVVGDADQTINTFQGSNIENFSNYEKHYGLSKKQKIELLYNYRSTKNIVQSGNQVISLVQGRSKKTIKTKNEDGSEINLINIENFAQQGETIAKLIQNQMGKPLIRRDGKIKKITYGDFAIVTRINAKKDDLLKKLELLKIPVTEKMENPGNKVAIGTVHVSKGLEFPFVFVTDFINGLFPLELSEKTKLQEIKIPESLLHYKSSLSPEIEHDNEEVRICYVATTRAIHSLYIISYDHGLFGNTTPSRFLEKLIQKPL